MQISLSLLERRSALVPPWGATTSHLSARCGRLISCASSPIELATPELPGARAGAVPLPPAALLLVGFWDGSWLPTNPIGSPIASVPRSCPALLVPWQLFLRFFVSVRTCSCTDIWQTWNCYNMLLTQAVIWWSQTEEHKLWVVQWTLWKAFICRILANQGKDSIWALTRPGPGWKNWR